MALDGRKNFAYSTVLTPPSPAVSGDTIVLAAGDGDLFPDPAVAPYNCVVWPATEPFPKKPFATIVRVTAKTGDTLTTLRDQEGSLARAIVAGDQIINAITAKIFDDVEAIVGFQEILVTQETLARLAADAAFTAQVDLLQVMVQDTIDNTIPLTYLDPDGSLTANSDAKVATQKAVKEYADGVAQQAADYADSLIAANDAMLFKGVIDCSANPNYPAADRGWTYRVSVAGKIGGASGANVEAGDLLLCLTDGTASGTQAAVGAQWAIAQTNLDGSVIGPASVTDGNPALFDGVTGKLIKQVTFPAFKTSLALVAADVGLGSVDNTADTAKPVSTAQQAALDAKVTGPASVVDDLPAIFDGITGKLIKSKTYAAFKALLALVKGDVGLGNVDNTSDATKDAAVATLTNKKLTAPVLDGTVTGTGVSVTAVASTLVRRSASGAIQAVLISVDNVNLGYTTTVTAAGTTTLTTDSTNQQYFTGSTTQTVTLPVTSTLVLGKRWFVVNNSTGLVTVNSSGGNAVLILAGNTSAVFTCKLITGTDAASWDVKYYGVIPASGKALAVSNNLTLAGTDGKTLTVSNSITMAGTDATVMTFPTTSATIARTDALQSFTGRQTFLGGILLPNAVTVQGVKTDASIINLMVLDGSNDLVFAGAGSVQFSTMSLFVTNQTTPTINLNSSGGSGHQILTENGGNFNIRGNSGTRRLIITQTGLFTLASDTAVTNAVSNNLTLQHNTSGTPANNLGSGILTTIETSTTISTNASRMRTFWADVTHATRKATTVISVYDTAERDAITITTNGTVPAVLIGGTLTAPTIISTAVVRLKGYTVATLPAGTQGDTAFVTDALAPAYLAALVGGGAIVTPVFYNGAGWVSH